MKYLTVTASTGPPVKDADVDNEWFTGEIGHRKHSHMRSLSAKRTT